MKHLVILYPAVRNVPNGGLKVVYDYANRLANDGYNISIVYASYFPDNDKGFKGMFKSVLKYIYQIGYRKIKGCSWYKLHSNINELFVWEYNQENVPSGNYILATAVTTAKYADALPGFGRRLYIVQDFETFIANSEEYIYNSYRLPLIKIAISSWIKDLVDQYSPSPSELVVNGFNFNKYYLTKPIRNKSKHLVSMLYHTRPAKGTPTAFEALKLAKKKIPDLEVNMFGVYKAPKELPKWIHYIQNPTEMQHLEINNQAAIYLGCSIMEGWGLTVGEAMMCGQAVVCTDNKGYLEMAKDGYNALVAPVGDSQTLANNIVRLITDDNLRYQIASNGLAYIRQFDIEESYRKLKNILEK